MDIAVILIVVVIGTNKIVIKIEYFLIKFKGVQKMNNIRNRATEIVNEQVIYR